MRGRELVCREPPPQALPRHSPALSPTLRGMGAWSGLDGEGGTRDSLAQAVGVACCQGPEVRFRKQLELDSYQVPREQSGCDSELQVEAGDLALP